jgi:hypothetical protein
MVKEKWKVSCFTDIFDSVSNLDSGKYGQAEKTYPT